MLTIETEEMLQTHQKWPIIDVRSPAEHAAARIPGAINLPLFSDAERAEIGTLYKQIGQSTAIKRAYEMVNPRRLMLVELAKAISKGHPCVIHCWRGGLRSASVAELLREHGMQIKCLSGGYKEFRRWAMSKLAAPFDLRVLGGLTGCGKTEILMKLQMMNHQIIDIEGLAKHKGSAFGGLGQIEQPTQINFENEMAIALSGMNANKPIWVEDESRHIGQCQIPGGFWRQMRLANVLFVNRPIENRIERLLRDYGGYDPNALAAGVNRIRKRFGPNRTKEAIGMIHSGRIAEAIALILKYYDKGYRIGLSKRIDPKSIIKIELDNRCTESATKHLIEKVEKMEDLFNRG